MYQPDNEVNLQIKAMLHWYALQSKPREEEAAWQYVLSKGIECYYPCVRVCTANPRAKKVKPYFPGYLFVRLAVDSTTPSIFRWMPHLVGLVCCGDDPALVPDALVMAIQRRVAEYGIASADPAYGMKHGDHVRIQVGLFEGYEAIFDTRLSGDGRVRVLLEFINGKSLALDLHAAQVECAPSRRIAR